MLLSATLMVLVAAEPNVDLISARQLVKDLRYPEAVATLNGAKARSGNDKATLTEILWLQGLVAATLGKGDDARSAFRTLCSIDGDYSPPGEYPPKVMGPFYEAKGWAASAGRLKFETVAPTNENGRVVGVGVRVVVDPLNLGKRIRFHLQGEGAAWYVVDATLDAPTAKVAWKPESLSWWAELLGELDGVVATTGSEANPNKVQAPAVAPIVAVAPVETVKAGKPFFSPTRGVAIALLVVGVAAGVVGAGFTADANTAASKLKNPQRDASGNIISLTQRDAYALNDQANASGNTALGMFIGSGALLTVGAVLLAVGAPADAPADGPPPTPPPTPPTPL